MRQPLHLLRDSADARLVEELARAAVLRQVEGFVAAGGNELVLSGINLGRWGRDLSQLRRLPRPTLPGWCGRSFSETELPRAAAQLD